MNVTLLLPMSITSAAEKRIRNGESVQIQRDPIFVTVMMDLKIQTVHSMTASVSVMLLLLL